MFSFCSRAISLLTDFFDLKNFSFWQKNQQTKLDSFNFVPIGSRYYCQQNETSFILQIDRLL